MRIVYLDDVVKTLKTYFATESTNPNDESPWSITATSTKLGLSYGATLDRVHKACSGGDPLHGYSSIFRFNPETGKLEPVCPQFLDHYPLRDDQEDEAKRA